ncbi:MAG: hypothetical protein RR428_02555 [Coprobacillus sp.]
MKKVLLVLLLLLTGCSRQPQYYLYLYYAKTCPVCHSFIENVIPKLEDKYGNEMKIVKYDIDEEASLEAYAKTCSLLDNYYVDDNSGSVPFIVLDGYFAKVGYDLENEDMIVQAIYDAIDGKELSNELTNIYKFKEGKTFH